MNWFMIDKIITAALTEDIGTGDITTQSCIPSDKEISGKFIAKEQGIICGINLAARVFFKINPHITMNILQDDGCLIEKGTVIAEISGNARDILTGERVALNLLQRLSGIATRTRQCVDMVSSTSAKIVDTRKTTPGLRVLEKYAVKTGGGCNHRYNLSDGILIKDNHICAAGSITKAVQAVRKNAPHTLKIEVEVENFSMIQEALDCETDIIMLDNMSIEQMAEAVKLIDGRAITEASGNMGSRDLLSVAKTGVDIISIGALTHTVQAMDISLRFAL